MPFTDTFMRDHPLSLTFLCYCFATSFSLISLNSAATATIAGNPAVIESMIKEHESHVMDVFRNIDRLANQYGVYKNAKLQNHYFKQNWQCGLTI